MMILDWQCMVLANFLSEFSPRMASSVMPLSTPPPHTGLRIRVAASALRQGPYEGDDEPLLAFSLAISIVCLRNASGM